LIRVLALGRRRIVSQFLPLAGGGIAAGATHVPSRESLSKGRQKSRKACRLMRLIA
jgi:hypothetical protein